VRQDQVNFTVYQLGDLNLRSDIETSLWEANDTQPLYRFVFFNKAIKVDNDKYRLPNGGFALDEIADELSRKHQIKEPAIFFTSLPLGDRASGTKRNDFWFDNYDVACPKRPLIISTYWWERKFKKRYVKPFILMELSGFFIWSKTGIMPHEKVRKCINDLNDDIVSVIKCFEGNGFCSDCWPQIEGTIDNRKIGFLELATALKLFYKAKDQKICFVAMPFRKNMESIFGIIHKVLKEPKWSVLRADKMKNFRSITNAIFYGIFIADSIIADLTGKNANVAFELGIATALSKNIYLITQNKKLPFDLQDKRTIFYGPVMKKSPNNLEGNKTNSQGSSTRKPNLSKLKTELLRTFEEEQTREKNSL